MRRSCALACAVLLLTSCQSQPAPAGTVEITDVAQAEAIYARAGSAAAAAEPAEPADAVTAELLRAALAAAEQARSIHLANLANVLTPAYKRRVPVRSTRLLGSGDVAAAPLWLGSRPDFDSGVLEVSDRPLDVAIEGDGLFAVLLPTGEVGYTRDGRLHLDGNGKLVDAADRVVVPEITLPADLLSIDLGADGTVQGRTAGHPDSTTQFGQLTLTRFMAPDQLRQGSGNLWLPTPKAGKPMTQTPGSDGLGVLRQGFVERSNVVVADEQAALQAAEQDRLRMLTLARRFGVARR